jgi:hypothetical protein
MRSLILALYPLFLIISSSAMPLSAIAQSISESQMRAANMARMQAEALNGGLSVYTADDCMHRGGGAECLVSATEQGYRFRFLGGAPGWASKGQQATVETEVLVSADGQEVKVKYNGSPRKMATPKVQPSGK